ncbi:MAG: hypothetical protein HWE23_04810 [Rhodobacteraceae bacterium]|nr:hypothetical protein [Paracoccaceae bacterium]
MKNGPSANVGWFVAGGLLIALIGTVYLYNEGFFQEEDEVSIELKLPKLSVEGN